VPVRLRILVTSPAGYGHIQPLVPLARALVERGHEVRWATPADGVPRVQQAGITVIPAGPAGLTDIAAVMHAHPELGLLPVQDRGDVLFGKLFGERSTPPILEDLAPVALDWQPHLVLSDAGELAGAIVASELGVPNVTKGFGRLLPERRFANAGADVADLWRSRGLEPRPYGGLFDHLYLDIYPPVLDRGAAPHIPRRELLRPDVDDGHVDPGAALPLPAARADAPLVYVTMGTVFNAQGPFRAALDALARLPVRAVVTVGPQGDPDALGSQPAYVRVERYVPQTALLPHCAVVASHGGSGTVLAAARFGLPQLCLPQGADQFLNADAIVAGGAGLSLSPDEATADAVGDALDRLLHQPSFAEAASGVAASIASMPSPHDVAATLEALA